MNGWAIFSTLLSFRTGRLCKTQVYGETIIKEKEKGERK